MRSTLLVPLLAFALPLAAGTATADVLTLPEAKPELAPPASIAKPPKGLSMGAVERQFGTPSRKHPAVGGGHPRQPPITRWDYPGFSVFFEHDHVVDAVVPGQPPTLHHADELQSTPG